MPNLEKSTFKRPIHDSVARRGDNNFVFLVEATRRDRPFPAHCQLLAHPPRPNPSWPHPATPPATNVRHGRLCLVPSWHILLYIPSILPNPHVASTTFFCTMFWLCLSLRSNIHPSIEREGRPWVASRDQPGQPVVESTFSSKWSAPYLSPSGVGTHAVGSRTNTPQMSRSRWIVSVQERPLLPSFCREVFAFSP